MRRLQITSLATRDIDIILDESEDRFGLQAAEAYRALLAAALVDLRTDPERPTVRSRPGAPTKLRFYHTRHSRSRAPQRINHPRHLIVFTDDGETVEVLRVLHDAMDIDARLSESN